MKDHYLKLVDVNLSFFSVKLDKNEANIEFLNMDNGDKVCTININNIITLQYQNNIDAADILPAYIGELEILKNSDDNVYYLKMQGWLDLSLVCVSCSISYPYTIQLFIKILRPKKGENLCLYFLLLKFNGDNSEPNLILG